MKITDTCAISEYLVLRKIFLVIKKSNTMFIFQWHSDKIESGAVFDARQELISYCKNDVTILRMACVKFQSDVFSHRSQPFSLSDNS